MLHIFVWALRFGLCDVMLEEGFAAYFCAGAKGSVCFKLKGDIAAYLNGPLRIWLARAQAGGYLHGPLKIRFVRVHAGRKNCCIFTGPLGIRPARAHAGAQYCIFARPPKDSAC